MLNKVGTVSIRSTTDTHYPWDFTGIANTYYHKGLQLADSVFHSSTVDNYISFSAYDSKGNRGAIANTLLDTFNTKNGISIYISKNGNDLNFGFLADRPIQTISRLYSILKSIKSTNNIVLHFGNGELGTLEIINNFCNRLTIGNISNETPIFTKISLVGGSFSVALCTVDTLDIGDQASVNFSGITVKHIEIANSLAYSSTSYGAITFVYDNNPNSPKYCFKVRTSSELDLSYGEIIFTGDFTPDYAFIYSATATNTFYHNSSFTFSGTFNGKKIICASPLNISGNTPPMNLPGASNGDGWYYISYNDRYEGLYPLLSTSTLGNANFIWADAYIGTGSILSSYERIKTAISEFSDAVLDAWEEVQFAQFQFIDAIEKKGNNARLHSGLIAQRIETIFRKHNLDPFRYGLLCFDKWEEKDWDEEIEIPAEYDLVEVVDVPETATSSAVTHLERQIVTPARTIIEHHHEDGGERYGIRYEEALCLEAAYQRRRASRLEARIAVLEEKLR